MSYIVGVSSGWWSIARNTDLLGLASKIGSAATYGINFVQVDFESISEFQEPDVVKNIVRLIDTLQINWGMHAELGEGLALESALEIVWKQSHRRLNQYLDSIYYKFFVEEKDYLERKCRESGKRITDYLPKYIVFHASNLPTISMVVERYRYAGHITVDINGNPDWVQFFEKENDIELKEAKARTKKWIFNSNLLYFIIARESGLGFESIEDIESRILSKYLSELIENERKKLIESGIKDESEILKKLDEVRNNFINEVRNNRDKVEELAWKFFEEITSLRFARGAITYEEIAYLIIARYLYEARNSDKEPLWKYFFGNKSWEELEKEIGIKFFDENKGEVRLPDEIVAMVASRYILGHFMNRNKEEFILESKKTFSKVNENVSNEFEKFLKLTPFSKIKKIGIRIVFENPEISRSGEEGLQRLCRADDIYRMVKCGDELCKYSLLSDNIDLSSVSQDPPLGMVFDQEHYLHNNMDPIKEIERLKNIMEIEKVDIGRYLLVFHVGSPKPYHPAHEPIDIGSEAQYWIYKYAYELRKIGFGKGKNVGILIFERGGARGGQIPAQYMGQSAAALKIIVEYLEKEIKPEELPMEFYGVSSKEILSYERQLAIIKEHFFDPLKGTLKVPEESHTFLGKKAIERGKTSEEWKKEELK
ncbi:MAG: hypothetical protein QXW01_03200 [Candidatus Aenigmatarchaeota archaeon]